MWWAIAPKWEAGGHRCPRAKATYPAVYGLEQAKEWQERVKIGPWQPCVPLIQRQIRCACWLTISWNGKNDMEKVGEGKVVLHNRVLAAALIAGIIAQFLKVIINYLVKR